MKTGQVICGGVTLIIGIVCVAVGSGVLPGFFSTMVFDGVVNSELGPKSAAVAETQNVSFVSDTVFYVYNYTNAKDVLVSGAKPIIEEVKIEATRTTVLYNQEFDAAADTYGNSLYMYYDAKTEGQLDNLKFVSINPVYFASVTALGSELGLQASVVPGVIPFIEGPLVDPDQVFLAGLRMSAPSMYVGSLMGSCDPANYVLCANIFIGQSSTDDLRPLLTSDMELALAFYDLMGMSVNFTAFPMAGLNPMAIPALLSINITSPLSIANVDSMGKMMTVAVTAAGAGLTVAEGVYDSTVLGLVESGWTDELQYQLIGMVPVSLITAPAIGSVSTNIQDYQQFILQKNASDVVDVPSAQLMGVFATAAVTPVQYCTNTSVQTETHTSVGLTGDRDYVVSYFCQYLPSVLAPDGGASIFDFNTTVLIGNYMLDRVTVGTTNHDIIFDWYKVSLFAGQMTEAEATAATVEAMSGGDTLKTAALAYMPTTWSEVGVLQIATGYPTRMLSPMAASVLHLGGGDLTTNPPDWPEFYSWQIMVNGKNDSTATKLTIAQTNGLMTTLKNPAGAIGACLLMAAGAGITELGIDSAAGVLAASYFCDYLSEKFVFKFLGIEAGLVQPDGTMPNNGGPFGKYSLREILHGYNDPLMASMGLPAYPGIYLPEVRSADDLTEEQLAGARYTYNAGNKDFSLVDTHVSVNNNTQVEYITDVGLSCPDALLWQLDDPLAAACKLWNGTQEISGTGSPLRMAPLSEGKMPSEHVAYMDQYTRTLRFELKEDVEIKGIKMHRYELDNDWKSVADAPDAASKNRSTFYDTRHTGFLSIQRAVGMTPFYVSTPRDYLNPTERAKLQGKTTADWEDGNKTTLGTYIDAEPLTGMVMSQASRMQMNMKIEKSRINGLFSEMYTANDHVFYPIFWTEDAHSPDDEAAKLFTDAVYGGRALGGIIGDGLLGVGVVTMVGALVLIGLGVKGGSAGKSVAPKADTK